MDRNIIELSLVRDEEALRKTRFPKSEESVSVSFFSFRKLSNENISS